jgi:8-oxo-dGTP diphosphatase
MQAMRNDFTATGFVLNKTRDKVLLIFHKKLGMWLPPGGHLDLNELPHDAVIREVFEETGLKVKLIDTSVDLQLVGNDRENQMPTPYCILHERIPASSKDVEHMHFDFIYLMCTEDDDVVLATEEIHDARWFDYEQVVQEMNMPIGVKRICANIFGKPKCEAQYKSSVIAI